MPIDTEDQGLIQDCRENPVIGQLVELHSQTSEHRPDIARLCEILIGERREVCASARLSVVVEAAPEPKRKSG